eukprot:CAMPEP_0201485416 /NCGR_PEP_ID=MMETSP0151_2-20130828/9529_1 /ASSEMBLY_ACC=CAM_ASM_000257 /TAXON_ID=200890 /ORGANISM="Paramoeba atlantica, Strain 621/1 / CCAP 1560/9" /LENGTH=76 /DNA_ID=CAMNT_0047869537 /DNA_START=206 /DNA_END=436 /DNA_ORIENTATION=-
MANYRLGVLQSEPDWRICEEKLGFQLEQLITHAEDELKLIPLIRSEKIWEVSPDHKVQVETQEVVWVDKTQQKTQE